MPELPEVETTARGIAPFLLGQRFVSIRVNQPSLRWPIPPDFSQRLVNELCLSVTRRAKYLMIETQTTKILSHLGMSGSFRLVDANTPLKIHDHVQIQVGDLELRYHDPRRFGCLLWADSERARKLIDNLGPEPLSDEFCGEWLYKLAKRRTIGVKSFIMTNSVVVGVGNIYASESLFLAGIHPARPANRISHARYNDLAAQVKKVLTCAIEAGGTTLRDFVNGQGEPGYFQQALSVYGRVGDPCKRCRRAIGSRMIAGRNSFFCPRCQT
ncbi:MAG TPA: DNA-formamidopyrimidine glycosylase [Gammaproteobacteria bacterium]|nr:DNA-formamidopyrimidine glycosylase [Gammaproteobacteria bacterium]HBX27551.1 DNA-formamidopyrimidine glycosylase [Gammaproteobacteria bacterium]